MTQIYDMNGEPLYIGDMVSFLGMGHLLGTGHQRDGVTFTGPVMTFLDMHNFVVIDIQHHYNTNYTSWSHEVGTQQPCLIESHRVVKLTKEEYVAWVLTNS